MHGYLMILLQDQNEGVLDALADIFRSRRLLPDAENRELLDKICEYPKILRHHRTESIGECLETIVLTEPDRVFRARERITSHFQAGRSV